MNIEKRLKSIIMNVALNGIREEDISKDTILTIDLGYDSIKLVELVVEIENEFNIIMDDEDLDVEKLSVYNKLLETIIAKVS